MSADQVINVWNLNDVKACLDECATKFLKKERKLVENNTASNITLVLGYIGCILAAYAHFTPIPFPQNMWVLVVFVIIHGAISLFLQIQESFIEGDRIFKSKSSKGSAVEISSSLLPFNNIYTLSYKVTNQDKTKINTVKGCISQWFHANGQFSESKFKQTMREQLLLKK